MTIKEFIQNKSAERFEDITEMPQEEGGFGRLYRAKDATRQNTDVCIKVIKANLSKQLQLKLWHDEVQALQRYRRRSGIVHLVGDQYQFAKDDPYLFIVMEYVHGNRLGASKYRIELDVDEDQAVLLFFQLCSVLYSIHQRGDYHQDIFPDNIKVQGDTLILLDLGGMREAERRSGTIIFGGEMYSAPEVSPTRLRMKRFRALRKQNMGSFETADIFSIGAILYELLIGEAFFEHIDHSNQLKEFIYDYYTDPTRLKRMKSEYQRPIGLAERNMQNFYHFLQEYKMPEPLCMALRLTLSIHPQDRPSIEELLEQLLPYMFQRANGYAQRRQWEQTLRWLRFLERHLTEIYHEQEDHDETVSYRMERHVLNYFPLYIQSYLLQGIALFHKEEVEAARQLFLKTATLLEVDEKGCSERQRNTLFLKTLNNLAACYHKREQYDEAQHLYKLLSTAEGKFGQMISRNVRACTAS